LWSAPGSAWRAQDLVWLALFAGLHLVSPTTNPAETQILVLLAVFQLLEPRVSWFRAGAGAYTAIAVKLLLGHLLIGVTFGIESSYYPILLLPVVSAATTLGWGGTLVFTLFACASYLSFLLFVDFSQLELPAVEARELGLRVLFFAVVGFLTHQLAEANRREARRYQQTAEQLAESNRSLREAEAAVRRADRLAALGQLTAGLAHELRNPLGTLRSSAELLKRRLPAEDEVARELAGFLSSEVDRTNSLVTRFLEFARPFHPRLEPTDLAELADRSVARIAAETGAAIYTNHSPDLPAIPADAEWMERVFDNLIRNAVEASSPGGAVTVKTRRADRGDGVEVSVIDRGPGIDPKLLDTIFNPFVTGKPGGVGLGLAIVSKIVDEHRGTVTVESEPGQGSVFKVYLPSKSISQ